MFKFKSVSDDDFYREGGAEPDEFASTRTMGDGRKYVASNEEKYATELKEFKAKTFNRERSCTNPLFAVIFVLFLGSMIYLTSYGFKNGNLKKLLAPLDGDLNFCGVGDHADHPKLLITDWSTTNIFEIFGKDGSGICVIECPDGREDYHADCKTSTKVRGCPTRGEYLIESSSVMNICIPNEIPDSMMPAWNAIQHTFTQSQAGEQIDDVMKAQNAILVSIVMSVVYSIIFVYIMSIFAETIAWLCVIIMQLTVISITVFVGFQLKNQMVKIEVITLNEYEFSEEELNATLEQENSKKNKLMAFTIILALFTTCFACCIFWKWTSLKRAIDVIDASADFLATTKRIVFVPILFEILTLFAAGLWFASFTTVVSMNEISAHESIPQGKNLVWKSQIKWMAAYMIFGIFWVCAWLDYTSNYIVMVSAASYYFNSNLEKEGEAEVALGFQYSFYNFGSLAIGSFIIAVVRMIRFVFFYAAKHFEQQSGNNGCIKCVVKGAELVLWCIEKICDYLNESAFAYQAVTGDAFFDSAWSMFLLQMKEMSQFAFANTIAKVFILFGKIAIMGTNMLTCYAIMNFGFNIVDGHNAVSSMVSPLLCVAVVSYVTASLFLGVLETAVLALLASLSIDVNVNGQPKYGPPTFHDKRIRKLDENDQDNFEKLGNTIN